MTLETVGLCPICKGTSFQYFSTCTDHTTSQENFELVRCSDCSFLVTSPRPTEESIIKYYESNRYISHTGGSKGFIDRIYRLARTYALNQKRKLVESYSRKDTILDYGSGTGSFLNHCLTNSWKAEGIEPSDQARSKTPSNLVIHSDIKSISEEKKFTAITLWHVLEHVHQLNQTLTQLIQRLEKDGVLFIAVPNHDSHDAILYKNHWAAYDVPRHLWHFRKKNISQLLAHHGLTVVDIKPMKLDSFYVSLLSEQYRSPQRSKLNHIINGFINGLISNLKARRKMNYSSLIYIAKR
jgi:2-polyprenyl-3-methyl-5-hydroxy-6-metoxy-1,4-benzoquinol methylase